MRLDATNSPAPRLAIVSAVVLLAAACGGDPETDQQSEPSGEALREARADSVQLGEARFDPAAFDTISWNTPEERRERGVVVWNFSCRKCHGNEGLGDGELARVEGLSMPVLTAADWQYGGDVPAIRRRTYVGHESEMPSWGLYGLKYRDIDAVAYHIKDAIRADK